VVRGATAGRMTAVMQAMRAGPKVLRVGVVVQGRLVDERILTRRMGVRAVTLASLDHEADARGAMFLVDADVPPRFRLFERAGDGYVLHTLAGMTGRIALSAGVSDLAELAKDGTAAVRLDESARGKVTLAGTTFLFQFVTEPPPQPRPRLPLSVKDGFAARIDWALTIVAAFSFLLHFGAVGAMYSDWMDTVIDEDITVGLVSSPTPVALPVDVAPDGSFGSERSTTSEGPASSATTATTSKPAPHATDAANVDALMSELARVNLAIVGSIHGPDARHLAVADGDGAPVDLGKLAQGSARVDTSGGLGLPSTGGPIVLTHSPAPLATQETATASTTAGRATTVVPRFDVHEEPPSVAGVLNDAEAVVRRQIHQGARHCYQRALESDPTLSGKLVLLLKVAPSGEVASASFSSNTGLNDEVARCIAGVARRARFEAPGPAGATIAVPFAFVRQ
jgi:hypothetical protein